jgi:uncharacterized protein YggE
LRSLKGIQMEIKPDTIKISASYREEILASHADLFVTVRGSSVIGGNEAMKKAKEVSQLVDELTRFGIPAENIHLQGVRIETSSGAVLKSSSASYRLRARCNVLDQIAELLDIITSQKNTVLDRIDWKHPEDEARERGLDSALTKAKAKAEKVAAALGIKLLGIYDFIENSFDEEATCHVSAASHDETRRCTCICSRAKPRYGCAAQQDDPCRCGDLVSRIGILKNTYIFI